MWKNWPYWLKGGVANLVVSIFLIILYFTISDIRLSANGIKFFIIVFMPYLVPAIFGYETCFMSGNPNCHPNAPEFFSVLSWFLLVFGAFLPGAIIGLIYGKMKK